MSESLAESAVEPFESALSTRATMDRERLLSAMVALCESSHGQNSPKAVALIETIFLDLVKRAEGDIRLRLAEQLSAAPWAPSGLINALALDDIEIARPVIAKSPLLQDHDLIRILTLATIEHQIEVARRPNIGGEVVAAILDQADPVVMTTLAGNQSAEVSSQAMQRLVNASQKIAALRTPLSRHPQLNLELATALYSWVGETLKNEIIGRFQVDAPAFEKALNQAVSQSLSGAPSPQWRMGSDGESEREGMETRLIAKLEAAGQLRPGFLLRSLREGKLHLFQVALASLASMKTEAVKAASNCDRPELLALACAAVGLDRSVFPTVLSLVRALNEGRPAAKDDASAAIDAAFTLGSDSEALAMFRAEVVKL